MRGLRRIITRTGLGLWLAGCLLIGLGGLTPARAEEAGGKLQITMSPAKDRIEIKAGETTSSKFKILNTGQKPFKFKVYASPYHITNANYESEYETETPMNQISRWIKFDQTEFALEPDQEVEVAYKVETPADIPDGAQYAVIFAETEPEESEGQQVVSNKRLGMLVYARGDGESKMSGESALSKIGFWQLGQGLKFEPEVKNTGNTDFAATVRFKAKSLFGKEEIIAEPNNLQEIDIIPDTTRALSFEWEETPTFGLVKLTTEIKYLDKTDIHENWVLFMSPLAVVIALLIVAAIIIRMLYGKKKKPRMGR